MQHASAPERLRAVGLRVTKVRVAILEVLDDARVAHEHLTTAAVADRVRPMLGAVSTQGVYDGLAAVTRTGLARAVEPAGHPARYEIGAEDAHHHLVCRGCGHIVDVAGVDARLGPAETAGFRVETTEVTFWGLCPQCATDNSVQKRHNREVPR